VIEFIKAIKCSDGAVVASLRDAKVHELEIKLFSTCGPCTSEKETKDVAHWLVANDDFVIDTLTTTANSRPKARKSNGGTKKRKAKTETPELIVHDSTPATTETL